MYAAVSTVVKSVPLLDWYTSMLRSLSLLKATMVYVTAGAALPVPAAPNSSPTAATSVMGMARACLRRVLITAEVCTTHEPHE